MAEARRKTIKENFIKWFLIISLLPIVITSAINYFVTKQHAEAEVIDYLATEVKSQALSITNWFDYRLVDVERLASNQLSLTLLNDLSQAFKQSELPLSEFVLSKEWEEISYFGRNYYILQSMLYDYVYDIFIIDNQGNLLFSITKESDLGTNLLTGELSYTLFASTVKKTLINGQAWFSDLERYQPSQNGIYGFITAPIVGSNNETEGVLAVQIKLDRINSLFSVFPDNSNHIYVTDKNGVHRSAIHENDENVLVSVSPPYLPENEINLSSESEDIKAYYAKDIEGHDVISVFHRIHIGGIDWRIVHETHTEQAFAFLGAILTTASFVVFSTVLIVGYFAYVISANLTSPIHQLRDYVKRVRKGEETSPPQLPNEIELYELSQGIVAMVDTSKADELKLKSMLNFQEAILNNLGEALILIDREGKIQRFSTAATMLFGYLESELIGKNIKCLMPEHFAKHHDHYLKKYSGAVQAQNIIGKSRELQGIRKDGSVFHIELVVTSTRVEGRELFVGLVKDISERIATQKTLMTALTNADAANRAKSEFLANMSHEIRTPMNGVYGALQVLKREATDDLAIDLIDKALFSCRSQLTIINDILDFSKIDAGMLTLENVAFSFKEVIQLVISDTMPNAKLKGIEISYEIDENANDGWLGDPVRVKQILLNLVANAVKFTEKGAVVITLASDDDYLKFSVKDTGIGMSKEQMTRLFTRFEQADTSTTRKFGGTGLGMAITQALIAIMKGSIDVESTQGKGTVFSVKLPLEISNMEVGDKTQESKVETPKLQGKKILLAEDNRVNQKVFLAMMKPTNAAIQIANNGKEAVDLVKTFEPDFIFMDIQMPEMDGMEACRLIKAKYKLLPIVALTANVMEQDIRKYEALGFDGHVGKPIELSALYDAITTHMI